MTQNYHIKMPEPGYEALQEIAKRDKRVFADIVRTALEEYVKSQLDKEVSFKIVRGGDRRSKEAKEN